MPTLNIDGQRVTVDDSFSLLSPAEQNSTVEEIAGTLTKVKPKAVYSDDIAVDVAKSAGIGAVKGTIGMADIPELGARGIDWATNKVSQGLGLGPVARPGSEPSFNDRFAGSREDANAAYNRQFPFASPKIQAGIEQYTGKFYQPQTPAGEVAQDVGAFLPGMVGGPGGLATRAVTQVAAPYLASKGAEALTKGSEYETAAKMAAALLSPSLANKALGVRGAPPTTSTTAKELAESAGQTYKDNFNVPVDARQLRNNVTTFERDLYQQRRPQDTPVASGILNDIKSATSPSIPQFKMQGLTSAGTGPPVAPQMTVGEMRTHRMTASDLAADFNAKPAERAVAGKIVSFIDRELDNVSPELRSANADYAAAMRAKDVQKTKADALIDSATVNSGMNIGNKMRQRFAGDLKEPYGFKPNEVAELERLNKGAGGVNALRYFGNAMGGGGGSPFAWWTGAGLGGAAFSPATLALAAVPVVGRGVKAVENAKVKRQVDRLVQAILTNAPSAKKSKQIPASVRAALAQALITSAAGRQPSR